MPSNGFYFSSHNGKYRIMRWKQRRAEKKLSETPSFHQSHYGGAACFDSCACKHCYILLTVFLLSCCSAALRCALVLCEVEELLQQRMLFTVYIYSTMMITKEKCESHIEEEKRETKLLINESGGAHIFFSRCILSNEICKLIDSSRFCCLVYYGNTFEALLLSLR